MRHTSTHLLQGLWEISRICRSHAGRQARRQGQALQQDAAQLLQQRLLLPRAAGPSPLLPPALHLLVPVLQRRQRDVEILGAPQGGQPQLSSQLHRGCTVPSRCRCCPRVGGGNRRPEAGAVCRPGRRAEDCEAGKQQLRLGVAVGPAQRPLQALCIPRQQAQQQAQQLHVLPAATTRAVARCAIAAAVAVNAAVQRREGLGRASRQLWL